MGNTTSTNPKVTSHDRAILQLKLQRDKLHKSKRKLGVIINREEQIAKTCIKAKKLDQAKLALRKKKRQESLLNNLERQSNTLEELIDTIEFKLIEKDVLYGLEEGNKVLKEINNEMNIEKVEKILDDTADAVAYQNELSERLGTQLTNGEELEVDDELRQLEIEMGAVQPEQQRKEAVDSIKQKLDSIPAAPIDIKKEEEEEKDEGEHNSETEEAVKEGAQERVPQYA